MLGHEEIGVSVQYVCVQIFDFFFSFFFPRSNAKVIRTYTREVILPQFEQKLSSLL